jgi:hypothetical protein
MAETSLNKYQDEVDSIRKISVKIIQDELKISRHKTQAALQAIDENLQELERAEDHWMFPAGSEYTGALGERNSDRARVMTEESKRQSELVQFQHVAFVKHLEKIIHDLLMD